MLPDLTASMISSSLPSSVPPWKRTSSVPWERLVTSSARYLKPMAPDSGGGMMWARSSLRAPGLAWPGAGWLPRNTIRATTMEMHATLRWNRLMDASRWEATLTPSRALVKHGVRRVRAAFDKIARTGYVPRGESRPPRRRLAASCRGHRPHAGGDGRHAAGRVPPLRDDVGVGPVRPALDPLLLGGGGRRVRAGVAHVHRRGHRHPARHALRRADLHRSPAPAPAPRGARRPSRPARRLRRAGRRLRLAGQRAEQPVVLAGARPEPPLALPLRRRRRRPDRRVQPGRARGRAPRRGAAHGSRDLTAC